MKFIIKYRRFDSRFKHQKNNIVITFMSNVDSFDVTSVKNKVFLLNPVAEVWAEQIKKG